jgi:HEPN domain-containing protein
VISASVGVVFPIGTPKEAAVIAETAPVASHPPRIRRLDRCSFSVAVANAGRYDSLMDDLVRQWAERAEYDLDTADAMLEAGRYVYVLFCCQQAVEKALKAVIVKKTGEMPPRIHNLLRLAETAGIESSQERTHLVTRLSGYYIQSRYPEEIREAGATITQEVAQEVFGKTEQTVKCVLSTLQ